MRASQGGCAGSNHAGTEQHGTDDRGARKQIVASDGTRLSVYEHGDRANPMLLAVHGYPDDHSVWEESSTLSPVSTRVVTYDMRGAEASDLPEHRAASHCP